jgi:hypothetical protein
MEFEIKLMGMIWMIHLDFGTWRGVLILILNPAIPDKAPAVDNYTTLNKTPDKKIN